MHSILSTIENPLAVLYGLQAATYIAAAAFARREDHAKLTFCYLASALLHSMLGGCHVLHLG